ncbi:FecR family protein [Achromobacter dolens]|uniref:FecR family protein n=1 Tax=Achromobacter dolens TaxID=1287738 RepID=UPI0006C523A8|nr:FecR domain-containing protein [Achromobacter dolens]CUI84931.1 fec operon regulator FecR [Achromobacter dolens]
MRRVPIPDAIAEQAARWVVRLSSDDAAERDAAQRELEAWVRQSPVHEAAARGMRLVVDRMQDLRGSAAQSAAKSGAPARAGFEAAFAHSGKRRASRMLFAIGAALLVAAAGGMTLRVYPASYLMADVRSVTGEWRVELLEDGSRVTLAGDSAVNLRFDRQRRELELVQGQALIEVAKDALRPFVVRTREARLVALGTRFAVDRHDGVTKLAMIESRVRVEAAGTPPTQALVVRAGQRVAVTAQGVGPIAAVDPGQVEDAWRFHQLAARDQPLADVLEELNRHRSGRIFYDEAALAGIRMTVVLPLDDTGRALRLLAESVPGLTLRFASSYFVWVGRTGGEAAR